jgi:hypothetical protein
VLTRVRPDDRAKENAMKAKAGVWIDHMTDRQIAAKVREYFAEAPPKTPRAGRARVRPRTKRPGGRRVRGTEMAEEAGRI